MKRSQSKLLLILLACLLVSSAWLLTGCQSSWSGPTALRATPDSSVATGTPKPNDDNPRNRVNGPGRKVVPPNISEPWWRHEHRREAHLW